MHVMHEEKTAYESRVGLVGYEKCIRGGYGQRRFTVNYRGLVERGGV